MTDKKHVEVDFKYDQNIGIICDSLLLQILERRLTIHKKYRCKSRYASAFTSPHSCKIQFATTKLNYFSVEHMTKFRELGVFFLIFKYHTKLSLKIVAHAIFKNDDAFSNWQ